jgi:hypothetical protein
MYAHISKCDTGYPFDEITHEYIRKKNRHLKHYELKHLPVTENRGIKLYTVTFT